MFGAYTFCRHSTRKLASIVFDNEQGDLFYSAQAQTGLCVSHSSRKENKGKVKKRKEKKKSNGPGRYKLEKKKFLAVGKARKAVF